VRCFHYKYLFASPASVVAFVLMIGVLCLPNLGKAQDNPLKNQADQKTIHIISDLLTTDNETGFVEFSGNVQATQGTTRIVSDRLKVYYKEDADTAQRISGGEGAVEKIVASGNVKINFDDKIAISNEAEYMTETQILVLSGPDSKVTTANESISGATITLYRSDGRIKVEGGKGKRVEAVFYEKVHTTKN
jgi:lipopolysaccharide export system protein LptA